MQTRICAHTARSSAYRDARQLLSALASAEDSRNAALLAVNPVACHRRPELAGQCLDQQKPWQFRDRDPLPLRGVGGHPASEPGFRPRFAAGLYVR